MLPCTLYFIVWLWHAHILFTPATFFFKTLISPKIAIFYCQHLNYAPVKQVLTLDLNKINFIGRCLFALNIFGSWSIPFLASGLIVSSDRKVSVTGTEPGGASRGHGTPVLLVLLVKFSLFCTVWLLLTKKNSVLKFVWPLPSLISSSAPDL
jgi:hypothetical protein